MRRFFIVAASACLAALSQAQPLPAPAPGPDFSEGGVRPPAAELAQRLTGNIYGATLANGATWRMDYKSSAGYVFFNISNGARDTAKWRTEDGRVCFEFRGPFPSGCIEYRVANDVLFFKRASGEIVAMQRM